MIGFSAHYIILAILILGMNTIPAFMPPTWVVLAFYYIHYNLNLFPVVLIGASCAVTGRIILAYLAKKYLRRFLPEDSRENMDALGQYLQTHERLTIPLVVTYAFLPIPSNQVFITAGLTKLNLKHIAFSFFIGRLISYTFWVSLAHRAADNLEAIFNLHFARTGSFIVEVIGFAILYLITKINWKKILHRRRSSK